jgi:molecular chaperone DnaJ
MPELNTHRRGDQLIHVNVWTPQKLSAEEKIMLDKLAASENFKPKPGKQQNFFDKFKEFFT